MTNGERTPFLLFVVCLLLISSLSQAQDNTEHNLDSEVQSAGNIDAQNIESVESDSSPTENAENGQTGSANQDIEITEAIFNIDVLIARMKQTRAIGTISKLSLKNKVDDLLEQASELKTKNLESGSESEALREDFEGLILKTIALLNKGKDFTLAQDIYLAREQLWKSIMENKA